MFTDTHCHLASQKYQPDEIKEIISRSLEAGITRQITLATGMDDIDATIQLADTYDSVYACLGIHPCDVTEAPDNAIEQISHKISHPKVVAIGESGLDYYHPAPEGWSEEAYHSRQRLFLEQQFELAAQNTLNICLHTRDRSGAASFEDCMTIYRKFSNKVKAVFHCFPGNTERAKSVLKLGGLISFTGNVTFKNARKVKTTASELPLESFMLETDAPYLTPEPHRGTRNEPMLVSSIAQHVAELRNIPIEELSIATENTMRNFFQI